MKVKINGDNWSIEVVTTKQMKREREDGEHLGGLCIPGEKRILLAEDCVDYKTVAHELFHAYVSYLYLGDTNDVHLDDIEEIYAAWYSDKGAELVKKSKSVLKRLTKGKR